VRAGTDIHKPLTIHVVAFMGSAGKVFALFRYGSTHGRLRQDLNATMGGSGLRAKEPSEHEPYQAIVKNVSVDSVVA
jgi:hypothetical protein